MRFPIFLLSLTLVFPSFAQDAEAPVPRPRPERPVEAAPPAQDAEAPAAAAPAEMPREEAPATEAPAQEAAAEETPVEATPATPARAYQTMCPAVIGGLVEAEALPPIDDGDCAERSPLSVSALLVNGRRVPLSSPAILNCEMAGTLGPWASDVDNYAFARENTRIEQLAVGTSYMCRDRNVAGGSDRLSEHGFADALDVAGFTMSDGRSVSVASGWADASGPDGRLLRFAHDAACARFSTVLGPEANAEHADHFHLDLGCHGAQCSARMCE